MIFNCLILASSQRVFKIVNEKHDTRVDNHKTISVFPCSCLALSNCGEGFGY